MNDKGYPKALEYFEKIWKEGLAEGKWQDDERIKIIFYDWFLTGWLLKAPKYIWHEPSEKPDMDAKIVVYHDGVVSNTTMRNYIQGYKQFNPDKWCYIDDIFPKE